MNPASVGSFESIPLNAIRPSPTNPRKHFDEGAMAELTASIAAIGVTVPIHVRSLDRVEGDVAYEIVTGERRYRASQAGGYRLIPAIVFDGLSDADAMDLQVVENLQRADLHPVEEAEGYRALMANGATAEDVAKKAGKTVGYVQQRLKLLSLEVDAKQLFADGHLTLGHALMLARLTPADQIRALVFLLGIAQWEIKKDNPAEKLIAARAKRHATTKSMHRLVDKTEAQLKDWIGTNVLLVLKSVPWDLGDAELLPIAGACTTCPKRTGANTALFLDLTTAEDVCTDRECFGDKQKAFTARQQAIAKEQGTPLLKISSKHSTDKLEKPAVEMRGAGVKLQGGKAVDTKKPMVVATKAVKEGQWVPSKKGACPMTVQAIATVAPARPGE